VRETPLGTSADSLLTAIWSACTSTLSARWLSGGHGRPPGPILARADTVPRDGLHAACHESRRVVVGVNENR